MVGEIKFFLMPADAHERARYDHKLRDAAEQAKRKCAALKSHPDVLARALNIQRQTATSLQMIPIIATAQGYGFSTEVSEVLVIDAGFLRLYLSGREVVIGMALVPATGEAVTDTKTFYETEQGAADGFVTAMRKPEVLTRFLDRVRWTDTPLPTLAHKAAVIEMPYTTDVAGFERARAEAMANALRTRR